MTPGNIVIAVAIDLVDLGATYSEAYFAIFGEGGVVEKLFETSQERSSFIHSREYQIVKSILNQTIKEASNPSRISIYDQITSSDDLIN